MSTRYLVDPEILSVLGAFPPIEMSEASLPGIRASMDEMLQSRLRPDVPVEVRELTIPGRNAPDVRALLLAPATAAGTAPAILHIHGGAYVIGAPEMAVPELMETADMLGCIILSVDYRLAPETPFPGPVEDCYAALGWMHANAAELGVDPARIAVMGESAGGGLAAALALLARDRGEHAIAFQLLDAPMIDDRTPLREPNPVTGEFVFRRDDDRFGWRCLLGAEPGGEGISPYAAPARATDLAGLPPAFIATGALDLFVDENIDYAQRLIRAGVPVALHVYPGCPHGFAMARESRVARAALRDKREALARALEA